MPEDPHEGTLPSKSPKLELSRFEPPPWATRVSVLDERALHVQGFKPHLAAIAQAMLGSCGSWLQL